MDQDMVMRARVQLLSANRRVVGGTEGLRIYRLLTQVEPEVYGSKLAYVLVEASASPLVRELPGQRLALLDEAVAVASALDVANPYRAKVLAKAFAARRELVAVLRDPAAAPTAPRRRTGWTSSTPAAGR
ncbi:hypothetical protein ACWDE0_25335 [Streptomyces sp. 900105755]